MAGTNLGARFLSAKRALFDKKYGFLNREQREAIYTVNGPLLILAGAGSGKTTVLVNRVAHIIRYGNAYYSDAVPADLTEGTVEAIESMVNMPAEALDGVLTSFADGACPPWAILTFTFTNKAANEMKERLTKVLGEECAAEIWAGTFHSVCLRILRRYADYVGLKSGFTIYDTDDSKRLIKDCLSSLNIDEKILPIKNAQNYISRAKDKLCTPAQFEAEAGSDFKLQLIAKVYYEYQKRLGENNAVDFDDIIVKTVELLQYNDEAREYYQRRFKYVCVDEYQDTNYAQFVLTSLLSGTYHNVMVVGDDDQSIYAFRGATIENILGFDKSFTGSRTIKLEQNYRSTGNILGAANSVIANNRGRHGKSLWTDHGEGDKVVLRRLDNQNEEARFIVDEINKLAAEGKSLSDFAVLYRTNAQSQALEGAFAKSGMAYRILGGTRFFDRKEIKDVIAYLCLINNPSDNVRLKRIINVPKRTIGDTTVSAVEQIAQMEGTSIFDVMERADQYVALARVARKLTAFTSMIRELQSLRDVVGLPELFRETLEQSGYRDMLVLAGEVERDRLENVDELVSTAVEYELSHEESTLAGFLEEVALVADIDGYEADADAVVLMTIHSAKGLEFPVVFLPGLEDGLFPGHRSIGNSTEMEEERRLAYVAITRAKEKLFITHAKQRLMFGQTSYNPLSTFVSEIDDKYLDKPAEPERSFRSVSGLGTGYQSVARAEMNKSVGTKPIKASGAAFNPGDEVVHMRFGSGVILSATDMGGDMLYEVAFDDFGTKKLFGSYAKLRKKS